MRMRMWVLFPLLSCFDTSHNGQILHVIPRGPLWALGTVICEVVLCYFSDFFLISKTKKMGKQMNRNE